jgi:hypothetical protein
MKINAHQNQGRVTTYHHRYATICKHEYIEQEKVIKHRKLELILLYHQYQLLFVWYTRITRITGLCASFHFHFSFSLFTFTTLQ